MTSAWGRQNRHSGLLSAVGERTTVGTEEVWKEWCWNFNAHSTFPSSSHVMSEQAKSLHPQQGSDALYFTSVLACFITTNRKLIAGCRRVLTLFSLLFIRDGWNGCRLQVVGARPERKQSKQAETDAVCSRRCRSCEWRQQSALLLFTRQSEAFPNEAAASVVWS